MTQSICERIDVSVNDNVFIFFSSPLSVFSSFFFTLFVIGYFWMIFNESEVRKTLNGGANLYLLRKTKMSKISKSQNRKYFVDKSNRFEKKMTMNSQYLIVCILCSCLNYTRRCGRFRVGVFFCCSSFFSMCD